jgi:hypothetical protein
VALRLAEPANEYPQCTSAAGIGGALSKISIIRSHDFTQKQAMEAANSVAAQFKPNKGGSRDGRATTRYTWNAPARAANSI